MATTAHDSPLRVGLQPKPFCPPATDFRLFNSRWIIVSDNAQILQVFGSVSEFIMVEN